MRASEHISSIGTARRLGMLGVVAATVLALTLPYGGSAQATTATATLSAGALGFLTTPPSVAFSATLNGTNLTPTSAQALEISDATGAGAGWNVTATSTTFTSGAKTLATTATTVAGGPTDACNSGTTCTLATNAITYPYSLPAGTTAPTATKLFNAAASTGLGNQTVTPTFTLAVPANTPAGTYTSTWTESLVSGP
jgi:hypothetical protein